MQHYKAFNPLKTALVSDRIGENGIVASLTLLGIFWLICGIWYSVSPRLMALGGGVGGGGVFRFFPA